MSHIYTVSQVNRYVKNMFTSDYFLRKLEVAGEVSNCKYHSSGHIYFSLKDENGALSCVMFAGRRKDGLGFIMKNGDQVVVTGTVDVYERDGRYQLYALHIRPDGQGILFERFQRLKQELEEMGMFDSLYKKPVPRFVRRLGVVTAPTGAAIQDIRNVALRRNPYVQIILSPALVQGAEAAPDLVRAIRRLDSLKPDVMIVGRGGGSLEDLWAFNEEIVARAVFECETPVISAVGHETDFTITDFVADLRAPTPSAAAELAVGNLGEILNRMSGLENRLDQAMTGRLTLCRNRLGRMKMQLSYLSPQSRLRDRQQRLADLSDRLDRLMTDRLTEKKTRVSLLSERLEGLSPLRKLTQGYSFVAGEGGRAVYRISQVHPGQLLTIHVTDGSFKVKVQGALNRNEYGKPDRRTGVHPGGGF